MSTSLLFLVGWAVCAVARAAWLLAQRARP